MDALSTVIHPEPGSALREFRNLVWDLSGSADFLSLEVRATLSRPGGTADRLVLEEKDAGSSSRRRETGASAANALAASPTS